jgi:formate dehydrogenase maturation protein FdhE
MSPNDASATRARSVHVCPAYDRVGSACSIQISGASPNVQYWRCEVCAIIWATRADGRLAAASG